MHALRHTTRWFTALALALCAMSPAFQAPAKKPNILFIMD